MSGRRRQQPRQRERGGALAASRLANNGEGLTLLQLEGDSIDRAQRALWRAKDDVEILDSQQPAAGRGLPGGSAQVVPTSATATARPTWLRTALPDFMTNAGRRITPMSFKGSPGTRIRSATLPFSMLPI
jgi:hypothetical protein